MRLRKPVKLLRAEGGVRRRPRAPAAPPPSPGPAQDPAQAPAAVGGEDGVEERERLRGVGQVDVDDLEAVRGQPAGDLGDGAADRGRRSEHAVVAHDAHPAGRPHRRQPQPARRRGRRSRAAGRRRCGRARPAGSGSGPGRRTAGRRGCRHGEPAWGRRHPEDAAPGRRDADAAADVGADRDRDDAGGDQRRPRRRSSRPASGRPPTGCRCARTPGLSDSAYQFSWATLPLHRITAPARRSARATAPSDRLREPGQPFDPGAAGRAAHPERLLHADRRRPPAGDRLGGRRSRAAAAAASAYRGTATAFSSPPAPLRPFGRPLGELEGGDLARPDRGRKAARRGAVQLVFGGRRRPGGGPITAAILRSAGSICNTCWRFGTSEATRVPQPDAALRDPLRGGARDDRARLATAGVRDRRPVRPSPRDRRCSARPAADGRGRPVVRFDPDFLPSRRRWPRASSRCARATPSATSRRRRPHDLRPRPGPAVRADRRRAPRRHDGRPRALLKLTQTDRRARHARRATSASPTTWRSMSATWRALSLILLCDPVVSRASPRPRSPRRTACAWARSSSAAARRSRSGR